MQVELERASLKSVLIFFASEYNRIWQHNKFYFIFTHAKEADLHLLSRDTIEHKKYSFSTKLLEEILVG
jgi:hypothetical protein